VVFRCNFDVDIYTQFLNNHNLKIRNISIDFLNFLFQKD